MSHTYVLIDDWVYMEIDGKAGVYGRQEIQRSLKIKMRHITACFLDYQTRMISLTGQNPGSQEALVNSSFREDYIVNQEKLSNEFIQVIGSPKEKIEEIYQYFNGVNIGNLVPYGAAIRAYLKSKNLLDSNPFIIFLDDLRNQAVLTFFEGMHFSSSRRITMRDTGYMITEIKRSWQAFISERSIYNDRSYILISNNQQWLTAFVEQGFLLKENIIHVDSAFTALEGLKSAKFTMHFALAQDVLKQKQHQIWKKRLKNFLIGALVLSLSLGGCLITRSYKNKARTQFQHLSLQTDQYKNELRGFYCAKFLSFFQQKNSMDYTRIYFHFIKFIPSDYSVSSIHFKKDVGEVWQFQAVIYPQTDQTTSPVFKQQSIFSQARISSVVLNKILGQQISLVFDTNEE